MLYIRIAAFFDKVFTSTLGGRFDFSTLVLDRPPQLDTTSKRQPEHPKGLFRWAF
jgi:hypothetical protein